MSQSISSKIANQFGSKKGLLRFVYFGAIQKLGLFNQFKPKDLKKVKRLVYVCSGNICRSPLGEFVAHANDFPSISFGLHCRGDDPAFSKTLTYGQKKGYPIEQHRSTNMKEYQPSESDLLIVMEPAHAKELKELFPNVQQVLLGFLTDWNNVYIHDPYNTNVYFFERCMEQISLATERLIRSIREG